MGDRDTGHKEVMSLIFLLVVMLIFFFIADAMAQGRYYDPCADADVYNPQMRVDCAFARIATPSYGGYNSNRYGSYGRRGRYPYPYGYQQNFDGLTVCDFSECRGLVGTFHAYKGKELHFRPFDPTDRRMSVVEGGALGAGGGVAIGKVVDRKGNRGAVISGITGAIGGGLIANSRQHNNCLRIRSNGGGAVVEQTQSRQTSPAPASVVQEVEGLEQKFYWNDTESVNTGIFYQDLSGTQYLRVLPRQRVQIFVLPGSDIGVMAEGILTPNGQRINKEIPYGKGKQYLPNNAGWRIFNVKLDQLDW